MEAGVLHVMADYKVDDRKSWTFINHHSSMSFETNLNASFNQQYLLTFTKIDIYYSTI